MWSPEYLAAEAASATTDIPPSTDTSHPKSTDPLILDAATLFSDSGSDSTRTVLDDTTYGDVAGSCESPKSIYKPQVEAPSDRWKRPYDWFHDDLETPCSETPEYTVESPSKFPRSTLHPGELYCPKINDCPLSSARLTAFAGSQFSSPTGVHPAQPFSWLDVQDTTPSWAAAATVSPASTFEGHFDQTPQLWEPRLWNKEDDHPRCNYTTDLSSHLHENIHSPKPLSAPSTFPSHLLSLNSFFPTTVPPTAEPIDNNFLESPWSRRRNNDEPLHSRAPPAPSSVYLSEDLMASPIPFERFDDTLIDA
ncbi:MAG: hypothetical protein Q9212_002202 [Teloschistes hypoglaucus]